MEKKKIIIIGAGISGLSAGIHALLKNFDVEIYESHNLVGGQCTAWHRKGYDIDGCIHWLTGSKKGTSLYSVWETCGALSGETEIVDHDPISSYIDEKGDIYYLYSDIHKTEEELMRISPEDKKEIKHFIHIIRAFQGMNPPTEKPEEMMNKFDMFRFAFPFILKMKKMQFAMSLSVADYAKRFKSQIIRNLLLSSTPNILAANAMFFMLGLRTTGDGGWVQGGSLRFVQRMQQRFGELGGKLFLNSNVKNIVIENNKATGIRLGNNDTLIKADYIVPAIDMYALLYQLLNNKYRIPYFEERFSDFLKYPLISTVLVSIGVKTNLGHRPHSMSFKPSREVIIGNVTHSFITAEHFAYDPAFSPDGNTLVEFLFPDFNYEYWEKLREKSKEAYKEEKKRIGDLLVSELQKVYPETEGKIELLDVATPLTYNRYCNAYKGAYMSFLTIPGNMQKNYKGTIDGIDNLFLAGQWVMPDGGLPTAALAGKFAVQRICKCENINIKF
ncbi:MAG: FAD-dependent oxidoreductase [Bacteroidales bacterium]|jgi:phytoene dehydrogenase-like protein|nr:FAD-dependent oxidoreductase [Bacteroidales bacterium]